LIYAEARPGGPGLAGHPREAAHGRRRRAARRAVRPRGTPPVVPPPAVAAGHPVVAARREGGAPAGTGLPAEYATIPTTFDPEALKTIVDWVAAR